MYLLGSWWLVVKAGVLVDVLHSLWAGNLELSL